MVTPALVRGAVPTKGEARRIADAVVLALDRVQSGTAAPTGGVMAWATANRRIDDRPFSLRGWEPLRGLYEDDHPRIVVMKPAQRGVSEWAVNLTGFALDAGARAWAPHKRGLNVAYLFPTSEALGDFSKERLSSLKRESAPLARLFAGSEFDAVRFKQVGDSYLYLRGAWSESALLSFAADVLILDEYDRMSPKAVALARRRLNASSVKREVAVSTPTVPGRGIHALYSSSDRRVYEQPCRACGAWVRPDFFRDVRAGGAPHEEWRHALPDEVRSAEVVVHCPSCGAGWSEVDRVVEGRWTAVNPAVAGLRGYHVPALAFAVADLRSMAAAACSRDPSEVEELYRSDLGLPYEVSGSRITVAMMALLDEGPLPDGPWSDVSMGVDVGSRLHYRVSGADRDGVVHALGAGSVGSFDELDVLMARWGVRSCVVDAMPELHACQAWAVRHPGRVLRAFYPAASALAGQLYHARREEGVVQINRTMALDALYAAIATAAERWPSAVARDPEVLAHLTAPVRTTRVDERGQERAEWVHAGPDHLAHAFAYDLVARRAAPPAAFAKVL